MRALGSEGGDPGDCIRPGAIVKRHLTEKRDRAPKKVGEMGALSNGNTTAGTIKPLESRMLIERARSKGQREGRTSQMAMEIEPEPYSPERYVNITCLQQASTLYKDGREGVGIEGIEKRA